MYSFYSRTAIFVNKEKRLGKNGLQLLRNMTPTRYLGSLLNCTLFCRPESSLSHQTSVSDAFVIQSAVVSWFVNSALSNLFKVTSA